MGRNKTVLNEDGTISLILFDKQGNNVRSNLRVGCKSDNQKNHKIRSDNKSGYIGVSWNSIKNKWVAQIQNNNVKIHIGYFNSEIDAAKAYDKICQTEHGEYAVLNFQGD